jgi:hypothetical protein
MSVGSCIILHMLNFKSYWYVCQSCDASIEIVSRGIHHQDPTCNCPNSQVVWCQTNVVESDPTNERQQMETTTAPYSYDANTLVTYKSIYNGEVTYPTLKVNELEIHLDSYRRLQDQLAISNGQISKILDNLTANGWYNPNYEKSEVLSDLCEILGHEPKQTVTITGNLSFEVSYEIPMEDVEDFDARYFLQDSLTLDSYHGDVCVESFDVEDADVDWS